MRAAATVPPLALPSRLGKTASYRCDDLSHTPKGLTPSERGVARLFNVSFPSFAGNQPSMIDAVQRAGARTIHRGFDVSLIGQIGLFRGIRTLRSHAWTGVPPPTDKLSGGVREAYLFALGTLLVALQSHAEGSPKGTHPVRTAATADRRR